MPNGKSVPTEQSAPAPQPREWIEIEIRVKVVALRFERRAQRLVQSGARAFEITAHDLIQHAWHCFVARKPVFDPTKQTLFKYFYRRMEDKYKEVCRDRAENDLARHRHVSISHTGYVGPETNDEQKVVYLEDPRDTYRNVEARDELDRLLRWLRLRYPDLHALARLITDLGEEDPSDQAYILGLRLEQIYELRRRLKTAARRFRDTQCE